MVILSPSSLLEGGKSGQHRAPYRVKARVPIIREQLVPQKIDFPFRWVKVKRWGKSPPL